MTGSTARSRPQALPVEVTSFVGRRRELAEVKRLLTTTRLLTLTGTGGAGKTRLALRAAAELARSFPDGVWFVSLASIEDPQLVTQAVFSALGLQNRSAGWAMSTLTDHLADKRALLVLDNCEHLLDSCAVLAGTLLKACPELRLLATSRQALGTAGEVRMRVPSLSLPESGAGPTGPLLHFDAVVLFLERATAVLPDFTIDEANAAGVLKLCRRLDGIPLALELAAARLEALTLDQLNEGLENELSVLGTGNRGAEARQQTLEETIGWSYRLLDDHERLAWARLSVFAGGFDEDAAIEVCSDRQLPAERIADLLGALVEKSVIKRNQTMRPTRYFLLDILRRFGLDRLREFGMEIEMRTRHREWILGLAAAAGAWDRRQAEMFNRVSLERDNVWSALDFCVRQPGEAERGIEICRQLSTYWLSRDVIGDSRRVVESLTAQTPPEGLSRARGLWVAGALATAQNDHEAAGRMLEDSLRLGRKLGSHDVVARALTWLAVASWARQNTGEALRLGDSALALARAMDDRQGALAALNLVVAIRLSMQETDDSVFEMANEGRAISVERGEHWVRGYLLASMAQIKWLRGEYEEAAALAQQALASKHALGDYVGLALTLETLAWMDAERGSAERAATLLGCAEGMRQTVGARVFEPYRGQHERSESLTRERLSEAGFISAFGRGNRMSIDETIAFVQDRTAQPKAAPARRPESPSPVTRRELEIARLIAEGVTTRQIAAKLFISERTVETHVTNMLNKLGLNSRIQLASWVSSKVAPPHS